MAKSPEGPWKRLSTVNGLKLAVAEEYDDSENDHSYGENDYGRGHSIKE